MGACDLDDLGPKRALLEGVAALAGAKRSSAIQLELIVLAKHAVDGVSENRIRHDSCEPEGAGLAPSHRCSLIHGAGRSAGDIADFGARRNKNRKKCKRDKSPKPRLPGKPFRFSLSRPHPDIPRDLNLQVPFFADMLIPIRFFSRETEEILDTVKILAGLNGLGLRVFTDALFDCAF